VVSSINVAKIAGWVRSCVGKSKGALVKVRVVHQLSPDSGTVLLEDDLPQNDLDADQIAHDWNALIQDDANSWRGRQTYTLAGYREGDDRPLASVSVAAEGTRAGGAYSTGELNGADGNPGALAAGFTAMTQTLLRHLEVKERLLLQLVKDQRSDSLAVLNFLKGENQAKAARITELEAKHMETVVLIEDLLSMRQEREVIAEKAKGEEKRKNDIFEKTVLLGAAAVNAYLGSKAVPEMGSPALMAVEAFLKSLDGKQFEEILSKLKPEQQAVLITVWERIEQQNKGASG